METVTINYTARLAYGLRAYFMALASTAGWEEPETVTIATADTLLMVFLDVKDPMPFTFNAGDHILHFGDRLEEKGVFWIDPCGINTEKLDKLQRGFKRMADLYEYPENEAPVLLENTITEPSKSVVLGSRRSSYPFGFTMENARDLDE